MRALLFVFIFLAIIATAIEISDTCNGDSRCEYASQGVR